MRQKVKEQVIEQPLRDACHHFWKIEVANGPKSRGTCEYCGEEREFYNAFPDFNPLKRKNDPFSLPEMPEVQVDEDSKS